MSSPETDKRRYLPGMVFGAGTVLIKHVLNLALLPVLIHLLGPDYFGLYMLLVGLLELSLLLDLGFADALVKLLARFEEAGDADKSRALLGTGHFLFLLLALGVSGMGLLAAPVFPLVFRLEGEVAALSRLAVVFIAIEAGITLYLSFYRGVLLCRYRHQWNHIGETLFHVIGMGGGAVLLFAGYGLPGLLAARLVGTLVRAALVIAQVARRSGLSTLKPLPAKAVVRELATQTGHAMLINLSVIVSHKIDTLVIALFLPIAAVGVYELVFRLLGSVLQLCLRMSEALFPLFARLSASSPNGDSARVFLRISSFNQILVGLPLLMALVYFDGWFGLLTEGQLPRELTWQVLLVAVPIIWSGALQIPASQYLYTSNRQGYLSKSSVITAVANLTLSLLLVKPLGVLGVALGTLIPQLIQHQFSLIVTTCRDLGIDARRYLAQVHLVPDLIMLAAVGLMALTRPWVAHSMWQILPFCAVLGVAGLLVWFWWQGQLQFLMAVVSNRNNRKDGLRGEAL